VAAFVERDRCPTCGSGAISTLLSRDFGHHSVWHFLKTYYGGRLPRREVGGRRYEISRCGICGLLWQRYILSDAGMERLYTHWISADESLAKQRAQAARRGGLAARELEIVARLLRRPPSGIRVLDFGMGWGRWCAVARAMGFDVAGVELSEVRRKYAQGMGVEAHRDLDAIARGSIDFANAEQVFEHLPAPRDTLRQIAERLSPRGIVRVSVPNARGIAAQLIAPHWHAAKDALHPLEHINAFDTRALEWLGREAGLRRLPLPRRAPLEPGLAAALREAALHSWAARRGTVMYFERADEARPLRGQA